MKKKYFLFAILFLMCGCATTNFTQSGFLDTYQEFEPDPDTPGVLVNYPQGQEKAYQLTKQYNSFIIDPIVVYISPEKQKKVGINPETLNQITDYFYDQLTTGLQDDGYYITDEPGEGIMRVRIALTDVVPSKPYLNIHWTTKLTKAGTGGASVEAEFIDSVSQERITAIIYSRSGRGLMYFEGFSKWGYAKDALQQWSLMLRKHLAKLQKNNQ